MGFVSRHLMSHLMHVVRVRLGMFANVQRKRE